MIPQRLLSLGATVDGRDWLERLPGYVEGCVTDWSLQLGPPFTVASESLVMPATRPDGSPVVLKISYRGRENEHEWAALAHWDGDGAIKLLDHDPDRGALLLERAIPGTPLSAAGLETALEVLTDLLPRLWRPAGRPFRTLSDEAACWANDLPGEWDRAGRPYEPKLLDDALATLHELSATQGELVLVHQDLHAGNVLQAQRGPWLAIDPKPLLAERAFSLAPVVRGGELGHSRSAVLLRLDRLSNALGLDRERARRWTVAQTLAWAIEGDQVLQRHLEVCRWLSDG
jgi:streptomycin 6-kinase